MKEIKNNLYMLRLIAKACPVRVVLSILHHLVWEFFWMLYSVVLMRRVTYIIEIGGGFGDIAVFLSVILTLSLAVGLFQGWFMQYYEPKTNVTIQKYLLTLVYKQAVSCDLYCYEDPAFYDKYTRANEELLDRAKLILDTFSYMFALAVTSIVYIIIVARYEPLIVPLVILLTAVSGKIESRRAKLRFECGRETTPQRRQSEYVKRTVYLQDFAKELRLGKMFFPLFDQFNKAAAEQIRITNGYYGKAAVLRCIRAIVMSLGGFAAVEGTIIFRYLVSHAYSLSSMVTLLNSAGGLRGNTTAFSWNMSDFMENAMYVENLREFLEYKPKITGNENGAVPDAGAHHIELKNVSFAYEGQTEPVIKNISIDLPPGKKIALVGHNGAGKSTLVKLLLRLYDVNGGEILLDGRDIRSYRLNEYRAIFTTVFQDFKIFAASAAENVLLRPPKNDADIKRAEDAVKSAGLYEKIKRLPEGINTQLTKEFDDNGALMSGGETQKLAVSRIFASDAPAAILDEPSSALDPISEYELFDSMMKACKGKTVIFISHRLSSAVMADKIYLLENGTVEEEGTHSELMARNGKYAQMFRMQAEKYREEEYDE